MREVYPGNRLVKGSSGIVFEVPEQVARGMVREKSVVYVDEPEVVEPEVPAQVATDDEPRPRRGRPPKDDSAE